MAPKRKAEALSLSKAKQRAPSPVESEESDDAIASLQAALTSSVYDAAKANKNRTKKHNQLKQRHAHNVQTAREKIERLVAEQADNVKINTKELAQELLDLLKQKRELEVQMVAAVKALYKAYDAMHRELSVVLADRANDIEAARGE